MQTIKTISNISYNSDQFFENTVQKLVQRNVIEWCYWVRHEPDTDETKSHIHFVLRPSKRLDTADLRLEFMEISNNSDKPLCCTTKWFSTNSIDDWLLYAVHDVPYLASKNQKRNIHYRFDDLKSTDYDALRFDWNNIDRSKYERLKFLQDAVDNHIPFPILVQQGVIPIAQRMQYEYQYNSLMKLKMSARSGRIVSHELADDDGVVVAVCDEDTMQIEF